MPLISPLAFPVSPSDLVVPHQVEVGSSQETIRLSVNDNSTEISKHIGSEVNSSFIPMYADGPSSEYPFVPVVELQGSSRVFVTYKVRVDKLGMRSSDKVTLFQDLNLIKQSETAKEEKAYGPLVAELSAPVSFTISQTLKDDKSGIVTFVLLDGSKRLNSFSLFLKSSNKSLPHKAEIPAIATTPAPMDWNGNPFGMSLEDGPKFRATLSDYEERIPALLSVVKVLNEDLGALESSMALSAKQRTKLKSSLQHLMSLLPQSQLQSTIRTKLQPLYNTIDENYASLKVLLVQSVHPILKRYASSEITLETLNSRKRLFEDESSKYYAWLSKYLGSGKSKDDKFLSKRKSFELSKIDYILFLSEFGSMDSQTQKKLSMRAQVERANTVQDLKKTLALLSQDPTARAAKAGILFTQNGQGKTGWHKQWVVLENGKLSEYMDWRKGESIRNKPIDISLASIKSVDSDKRKNCFRIMTSDGVEHVFQSLDTEDRDTWINALYDAGQQIKFGKKKGDLANRPRRISSVSLTNLASVQAADPSNMVCAECGSTDSVEWVSINLLTVFCVKCSSVHRSLGTSITKVRSLKLDNFSSETLCLLRMCSNSQSKAIWEVKLPASKRITANATDSERSKFISDKYTKRYVSPAQKPQELLVHGIKTHSPYEMLHALASGADYNGTVQRGGLSVPLVVYSLLHPSHDQSSAVYDTTELLFLNGAAPGSHTSSRYGLDTEALSFWQARIDKLNPKPIQKQQQTSIPQSTSTSKFSLLKKKKELK